MKKKLTLRYTLQQCAYWSAGVGVVSFAATFLLEKGFAASQIGILLACGNLLSCGAQPFLAGLADRIGGNAVRWLAAGLTGICLVCFGILGLTELPPMVYGALYLLGVFAFDAMHPLMNAISVSYNRSGYSINYGVGRGIGSFAYAVSALIIGRVMAKFGVDWMLWIALVMFALHMLVLFGYPGLVESDAQREKRGECCSVGVFFQRYRWYCLSLLGVMLLGMFHAMTENYMIRIVEPLGGDSAAVGTALFIATAVEMLVVVNFDRLRRKIPDTVLMKIAGLSFLLKAVLLLFAPNVETIYGIQLLQATSYSFLSPTQLFYANSKVGMADMVKGQAFITASYTLGCAAGNFLGGQLVDAFDVRILLLTGIAIAAAGTVMIFLTVDKKDSYICNV